MKIFFCLIFLLNEIELSEPAFTVFVRIKYNFTSQITEKKNLINFIDHFLLVVTEYEVKKNYLPLCMCGDGKDREKENRDY